MTAHLVCLMQVLGIERSATAEEIKSAYRKLARIHHPDRPGGNKDFFATINTAHTVRRAFFVHVLKVRVC